MKPLTFLTMDGNQPQQVKYKNYTGIMEFTGNKNDAGYIHDTRNISNTGNINYTSIKNFYMKLLTRMRIGR